ncbi:fatty acid hydroxylase family protein [Altererythrobacter sp. FM1]|uniref:Sterol desaturase family protein n=1 Tax=Tsuneonella flava TaxID=2055955 RepID=A0ABX7KEG9_9SPHN|nr:sterol desaturase family protein [Tsuneonella flava]QSB45997.1 sterol desaturase family protein [Tsuneonella flava]ROT97507.1 fatty acid hydroxylase family protein [Altererythrobacter sp. FM1]
MWSAIFLSALAMTVIIALRYIVSSGLFAWISMRMKPGIYDGQNPQIRQEIGWSLLSAAIYGIPAGIVAWGWQAHGWTLVYTRWDAYPLWYLPIAPLIYLFLHDTWFYWTHRLMHRPTLFRAMHAVHHASRPPTAWAAMSFHPYEAITGAVVIPLLVFIVPIHVAMLGVVLLVMTVMGIINHMGWEIVPRRIIHSQLGAWLITASHHHRHHEQYRCNFGLYFRVWDRLCHTDGGLSQP